MKGKRMPWHCRCRTEVAGWRAGCFTVAGLFAVVAFTGDPRAGASLIPGASVGSHQEGSQQKPDQQDAESTDRAPWQVRGTVTDADGNPLQGVTVVAYAGIGTLRQTGQAESNADGEYDLRFGPGVWIFSDDPEEEPLNLQVASIFARRGGLVERNLSRQGALAAANRLPPSGTGWVDEDRIVVKGEPYRLDFVMVPAAEVRCMLVDEEGEPLADRRLALTGSELPPSSNVLRSGSTTDAGTFDASAVPPGYEWWWTIQASESRREVRSPPVTFAGGEVYEVTLRSRLDESSGVPLLEIVGVRRGDADVTDEVVGDAPAARAPLPEADQVRGREMLRELAHVHRFWLDGPPVEVESWHYTFHLGDNTREYQAGRNDADLHPFVRRGIAWDPPLWHLAANPRNVVFRQIEHDDQHWRLTYTLLEPVRLAAGNGVTRSYHGFFSTGSLEGTLVIDRESRQVLRHEFGDTTTEFLDYREVRPGHAAPHRVRIQGSMTVDWRFRQWEPGLWLFDSSYRETAEGNRERVAWISDVRVNEEPARER